MNGSALKLPALVPIPAVRANGTMMSDHRHLDFNVRRVRLPSGKAIDVVYFPDPLLEGAGSSGAAGSQGAAESQSGASSKTGTKRLLHICPDCDARLVYPTAWEEHGESWQIDLRCPNCEWTESDVYEQELCDAFDRELDGGAESLTRDLRELTRANLAEEVERFAEALDAEAIYPMDF